MTEKGAGMTEGMGMTKRSTGMTEKGVGMTEGREKFVIKYFR